MKITHLREHSTKKQVLLKFIILLCLLGGYFFFMSWKYGATAGIQVTLITWSFFVLCTPIADGGFLLDFPLRILFNVRMIISEMFVWSIAITVNAYVLYTNPGLYDTTFITTLLKKILLHPWPYRGITGLSLLGTFLSIRFGDELLDIIHHRDANYKHRHGFFFECVVVVGIFLLILLGYYSLIEQLGISLPG